MFRLLSMRRLAILLVAAICFAPNQAHAAVATVQCVVAQNVSASSLTVSIIPTAGNTLVAMAWLSTFASTPPSTLQDSNLSNFTIQSTIQVGGTAQTVTTAYEKAGNGITGVTVTWPSTHATAMAVCEYSGLSSVNPTDAVDSVGGNSASPWSTGSMTPIAGHNEVVIGTAFDNSFSGSFTCTNGYTRESFASSIVVCDQIIASTSGSYSVTGTSGAGTNSVGATYTAQVFAPNSGGQVISAPMLPQATPNPAYPFTSQYPTYTVTPVSSGSNLQTFISGAACGTKLNLAHGGSFANGGTAYTLPNNSCACHTDPSKWIIIQGDQFEANYTPGVRVDPSTQYAQFPHISSTDGNYVFTANANGASCWGFAGLDVYPAITGTNAVFGINTAQSQTPANFSHDFAWWGVYFHGQPTFTLTRGMILNGNWEAIVDSYCADAHSIGQDSQCLVSWDGYGPFLFQNNFLEAATENTMFGGSPSTAGVMMSDITEKGNYFYKPLAWSINDPTYFGVGNTLTVKDLIEFKSGQRILVSGNVFEHSWGGGQNEMEIINSNCSISSPSVNFVQDVTEFNNIFRNATTEWFVFGGCAQPTTQPDHRIWLHDNLIYGLEGCSPATCGFTRFVDVASGQATGVPFPAYDLWITHNSGSVSDYGIAHFNQDGSDGKTYYGHQFTNNVFGEANIPQAQGSFYTRVEGNALAEGDTTYTTNFPGGNFKNNCFFGVVGGTYTNAGFANSKNPANAAAVFNNPGIDFTVSKSSVCSGAASDGSDMGACIACINTATAGVATLPANLPTVTNISPTTFTHAGGTTMTITGTNFNSVDTDFAVIIGGAGPTSTVSSMTCTNNVSCAVTMSQAITVAVNDTINVEGVGQNGGASLPLGQFTVSSTTDSTHFSFTVGSTISTATFSGGTINRYTPGNACTSPTVSNGGTTITCTTPAASGTVTTGPVSVFVSQWGIPVQSTVFGNYN